MKHKKYNARTHDEREMTFVYEDQRDNDKQPNWIALSNLVPI